MTFTEVLKENINKSNARLFIVLLLMTSAIWLVIQLSKTYTTDVKLNAVVTDIPIDKVVDENSFIIDYKLTASGFKLLWLNLKSNEIRLNIDKFQEEKGSYQLYTNKIATLLADKYLIKKKNLEFDKKIIAVSFSKRKVKSIDIKPQLTYSFATGYNSTSDIKTTPDSVKISGQPEKINKLNYLKTEKIKIENVDDTILLSAKLKIPSGNIDVEKNEVEIFLPVEKFTENEKVLPVNLVNVPDSIQVNYFPKNVSISYLVPISNFNKVKEEQFRIECDYNERFIKQGILIPELVKKASSIKNVSISPYKIEYLKKK